MRSATHEQLQHISRTPTPTRLTVTDRLSGIVERRDRQSQSLSKLWCRLTDKKNEPSVIFNVFRIYELQGLNQTTELYILTARTVDIYLFLFTHQQKTKYCIITTSVFNNLGYNNCIWENTLCFVGKSLNKHPLPSSPFRTPSSGNTPYNSFRNDGPQFYHFCKSVFFLW